MAEEKKPSTEKTERKRKNGLLWGIIGGLIVVLAVVLCIIFKPKTADDPTASPSYSKSFFISDSGKYSLWNADGKRLSDEVYSSKSDFVDGYAMVRSGDNYGIIKEDGQFSIKFGEYKNIEARSGLYLVTTKDDKHKVITGSDKEIISADKISPSTPLSTVGFAVAEYDNKVEAYFYDGSVIMKTEAVEGQEAEYTQNNDFGIIYYNDKNYVVDTRTKRVLATFDGKYHKFSEISKKRNKVLLKNSEDSTKYKLIAGGSVYDLNETKNYAFTQFEDLIGYDDYSAVSILDADNGYKTAVKVSSTLALKDKNNYVTKEDDKIVIYRNGQKVKTFEKSPDIETGVLYNDYYVICDDEKYGIYDLDGNLVRDGYKDIWSLYDMHGKVAVANEENKYYLIDTDGNRITDDTYYRIRTYEKGYTFRKEADGNFGIANEQGKLVTELKYKDTTSYSTSVPTRNLWTGKIDSDRYDLVDVDAGKIIISDVNIQTVNKNYFTVKNSDKKTEYYTLSGEKFYTTE